MEKLSPRSYITGGFDILKPALIDYIGKLFKNYGKTWWYDCIYSKLDNENIKIPRTGNVVTMHSIFDEYLCFKICRFNKKILSKGFSQSELSLIDKLYNIRNSWAHAPSIGMTEGDADNAFAVMIELMEYIDFNIVERLFSIREQMHKYYYIEKPVNASRESLISFLNDKVLKPAINNTACTEEVKRKVIHTQELLDKIKSAEEVSNFFWYNIIISPRGYDSHKKFKELGFLTFEDIRSEFNMLCYGE